jgi:uncharacterized protein YlxW (UPF0749 family)
LKGLHWTLVIVGLALGVLLAMQFKLTTEINKTEPVQRTQLVANQVTGLKNDRELLQGEVNLLRSSLDEISAGPDDAELKEQLDRARILAGVTELRGPGVEVTLNDSNITLKPGENPNLYVLHDEDVLRVLNEIRAAGAEALSLNGERILASTEVRCIGPTIVLNKDKRLAPPFVITAIGDPNTLESSIKMKGGVAEILQFWGIQVGVKKMNQVTVPAYSGGVKFDYAKAASGGG